MENKRASCMEDEVGVFTRSTSRSSLRASWRASKVKIDDFFKSPSFDFAGKRKRYVVEQLPGEALDDKEEMVVKRRSSLAKVASFTQLMTPVKSMKRAGEALQRTLSVRSMVSPMSVRKPHTATPYKRPAAAPSPKRRLSSAYWHETVDGSRASRLNKNQLERQEAIFELYKCEVDLIDDINMVKMTYDDSMRKLSLMSNDELEKIFGSLYQLLPIHEELVESLRDQRMPDGTTENIGQVLIDWVPKLNTYVSYCANQVYVKALLDAKKLDPSIDDFLQRCLESPFSRRLDVWSFLDVPRSRLVKYPLLLKSIQKHTPATHPDHSLLESAIIAVEELISDVDFQTGLSKCAFTISIFDYIDDRQKHPLIAQSKFILCEGVLSSSRGVKLNVFLFDLILVMTRPCSRGEQKRYQVYRHPIPVCELSLEDRQNTAANRMATRKGSFRNAFTQSQPSNNSFVLSTINGQSHTLLANDEQDKRHWLQQLRLAVESQRGNSAAPATRHQRHQSGVVVVDGSVCEEANTSMGSYSSFTSLSSVFSTNSASSVGSELFLRPPRGVKRIKVIDVDSDSGIVA